MGKEKFENGDSLKKEALEDIQSKISQSVVL